MRLIPTHSGACSFCGGGGGGVSALRFASLPFVTFQRLPRTGCHAVLGESRRGSGRGEREGEGERREEQRIPGHRASPREQSPSDGEAR